MIRSATGGDAARIAEIYNRYVLHSTVTFEEQIVSADEMRKRIAEVLQALPWVVWVERESVEGFAYATPWKSRISYRHSVESTIYLADGAMGRGIGAQLYGTLIAGLRERGVHTVLGGIALPNDASIALHEKLGFEKVAQFREVGRKFGKWIDVGYWQKIL